MKRMICLLLITFLFVFTLTACGGTQGTNSEVNKEGSEKVIKLKLADSYPPGHAMNQTSLFFIERLKELSNGRIEVDYYPSEQLGKLQDMLQLASSGTADITPVIPSFFAGQLPLNTVTILPFWTTAIEGMEIYKRLMQAAPELEEEFAKYGTKVVSVHSTSQYDVGTVKKPVKSPEELKGMKLKSSGGYFDKIAAKYGINTISIPGTEVYEAAEKGILDGTIMSYTSSKGYRMNEVQKFHTKGLRMGGAVTTYVINEKTWNKVPEDLQKIILQAGEESSTFSAELWDKNDQATVEEFQESGMTIYSIKPEDRAKWESPLKGIEEDWIKEMDGKGLPGKKVFDEYYKISKEVAK